MKAKTLFFLFSILIILSCSGDDDDNKVNIRLSNISNVNFENATFNDYNFGNIISGEKSEYKTFENAYNYGYVNITIDGESYGWIPIDYVGETPLKRGNYTFEYSFDSSTKILTDKLIKD